MIAATDPNGVRTTWTYTAHGKVASVTDPTGTTTYTYDLGDNVVAVTDPNGHATTYAYDEVGNVKGTKDARGNWTTNTYNANNWLTDVTFVVYPPLASTLRSIDLPAYGYHWFGRRDGI